MADYKTIRGTATFEYEEKRSRFIATASFADTEEKALAVLNAVRAANRTARHNVYAYVLQNGRTRYSDDGEPAKTAGTPVLETIGHAGVADVIVCEAFAGNIILKLYEGVAGGLMKKVKEGMMSSLRSKIGALLVKPALKKVLKDFDTSNHGGAPLLGLNGLVVKTHGSSKSKEVCNSIIQCVAFKEQKINEKIKEAIQQETLEEKKEEKEVE